MQRQQKNKIQIAVICGLLLLSNFDISEAAKTKSKSKSSGSSSGSRTQRPPSSQSHANPGSLSYSGISPNAPQPVRPSAPVQQPSYAAQAPKPAYSQPPAPQNYPASQQANNRPIGWNTNNNQQQSAPYPVNNQAKPNSPPFPVNNNQQQFGNAPPSYGQNPGSPPIYSQNPSQGGQPNYHNSPPAYQPQQPAYHPQPGYNPQQQPAYNPQPAYGQQPGGFVPQQTPQIVNHYHGVQPGMGGMGGVGGSSFPGQQNSGPGLLKTAVVAGAAGLGGAALYNAFKPDSDPKTTVIIVNNTQPAAPAPAEAAPAVVAPVPINAENPPAPNQQYPQQQQYPNQQQQYPNQQQQQYDPNAYNQQYNPNQQQYPQQPYDPNQQYNPAMASGVSLPPGQPIDPSIPVVPVDASATQTTPVIADASPGIASSAAVIESTTQLLSESSSAAPLMSSDVSTPSSTTILTNNSDPIAALSTRVGEAVEQKTASVTNQEAPRTSESKTENGGNLLTYSITVLSLSLMYQFAMKSLL